jgi:hypothetical protein
VRVLASERARRFEPETAVRTRDHERLTGQLGQGKWSRAGHDVPHATVEARDALRSAAVSSKQSRICAWIAALTLAWSACSDDPEVVPSRRDSGAEDDDAGAVAAGCTRCGGCTEAMPIMGNTHFTTPITYPDPPPSSGIHDPCWASWGVHTDAVAARNWVHNLEHGGVVFLYNCPAGCDTDLERFTALAKQNARTLLTEYPDLPTRFAVVAWGYRLLSDCVDVRAFQAFYDAHFDRGPESIASNPPSSCP